MLGNFFRRSAVQQRVRKEKLRNMKQYVETDSFASTGCEGK